MTGARQWLDYPCRDVRLLRMSIKSILKKLFGSSWITEEELFAEDLADLDQNEPGWDKPDIQKYISDLGYATGYARLRGPFLSEEYATRHLNEYKDVLCSTLYNVNCRINRRIVLLTNSSFHSFPTNDDVRVELGIEPYNHSLGLYIKEITDGIDFTVIEVDNLLLIDPEDRENIKSVLLQVPLTEKELDQWIKKEGL